MGKFSGKLSSNTRYTVLKTNTNAFKNTHKRQYHDISTIHIRSMNVDTNTNNLQALKSQFSYSHSIEQHTCAYAYTTQQSTHNTPNGKYIYIYPYDLRSFDENLLYSENLEITRWITEHIYTATVNRIKCVASECSCWKKRGLLWKIFAEFIGWIAHLLWEIHEFRCNFR